MASDLFKQGISLSESRDLILQNKFNLTPEKKEAYLVMFNDLIMRLDKEINKKMEFTE